MKSMGFERIMTTSEASMSQGVSSTPYTENYWSVEKMDRGRLTGSQNALVKLSWEWKQQGKINCSHCPFRFIILNFTLFPIYRHRFNGHITPVSNKHDISCFFYLLSYISFPSINQSDGGVLINKSLILFDSFFALEVLES